MASVGKKNIQWNLLTASDPGNEAIAERRCLIKQVTTLVPWVTLYNIKRHTQFGRCCPWTGKEVCMHNVSAWPNDPKMVCFFGLMRYAGRPKQIKSTNNLQNIVEKWWNVMCTNNIQQLKKYLLEVRGNLTTLCICKQFPLLSHMDSPCFFLIKWSSPTRFRRQFRRFVTVLSFRCNRPKHHIWAPQATATHGSRAVDTRLWCLTTRGARAGGPLRSGGLLSNMARIRNSLETWSK